MAGMTLTEQVLAKHNGKSRVVSDENIWVDVDVLMTHGPVAGARLSRHDEFDSLSWKR